MALPATDKVFTSTHAVELFEVIGSDRKALAKGDRLEVYTVPGTRAYPVLSARAYAGSTQWDLKIGTHSMRSKSSAGEPTYIFSSVDESNPELFYCVVFDRSTPAQELQVLEQILDKLTKFHKSEAKSTGPNIPLPQIDPKQINELMRKGAEDTQMVLNKAGQALHDAFLHGVEMHKKYAPKPSGKPVEVDNDMRNKLARTKQATAAGAAVAKGVATGVQAAATDIGTSLAQTVTSATNKGGKAAGAAPGAQGGKQPADAAAAPAPSAAAGIGGIGVELLRDIAAVRDAVVAAAGNAWQGAREATVEVMGYQYGDQMAGAAADACDVAEGLGSMGVALTMVQPHHVVLSGAKDAKDKKQGEGAQAEEARRKLEDEKAALEKERAALAAERAALEAARQRGGGAPQQQQGRPAFAWGF